MKQIIRCCLQVLHHTVIGKPNGYVKKDTNGKPQYQQGHEDMDALSVAEMLLVEKTI